MSSTSKTHLYVLKYEREGNDRACYKIGITDDPARRLREHEEYALDGWRRTLSFVATGVPDPSRAGEAELVATAHHIAAYGFGQVRGSLFDHKKQAHWPRWVDHAYKVVASVLNVCYTCHGTHSVNQCGDACDRRYFVEHGVRGVDRPPRGFLGEDVGLERQRRRLARLERRLAWTMEAPKEEGCRVMRRRGATT